MPVRPRQSASTRSCFGYNEKESAVCATVEYLCKLLGELESPEFPSFERDYFKLLEPKDRQVVIDRFDELIEEYG